MKFRVIRNNFVIHRELNSGNYCVCLYCFGWGIRNTMESVRGKMSKLSLAADAGRYDKAGPSGLSVTPQPGPSRATEAEHREETNESGKSSIGIQVDIESEREKEKNMRTETLGQAKAEDDSVSYDDMKNENEKLKSTIAMLIDEMVRFQRLLCQNGMLPISLCSGFCDDHYSEMGFDDFDSDFSGDTHPPAN